MQKGILLSIVMPIYNAGSAIISMFDRFEKLNQFDEIELIIVDDASTDSTYIKCMEWGGIKNKSVYIQYCNKGPGAARNIGLKYVNGKYVFFADSDDEILIQEIPRVLEILRNGPEVDMLCFSQQLKNIGELPENCEMSSMELLQCASGVCMSALWNWIFRTGFLMEKDIRCPETRQAEDYCFVTEALMQTDKIYCMGNIVYLYNRSLDNSLSSTGSIAEKIDGTCMYMRVLDKWIQQLPDGSVKKDALKESLSFTKLLQVGNYAVGRSKGIDDYEMTIVQYIDKLRHHMQYETYALRKLYICPTNDISMGMCSIIQQAYPDAEIIFADNNVSEDNPNIMRIYKKGFKVYNLSEVLEQDREAELIIVSRPYLAGILMEQIRMAQFGNVHNILDVE